MAHGIASQKTGSHVRMARVGEWATPLIWFVAVLAVWEIAITLLGASDYILPAPTKIFTRIFLEFEFIWPSALESLTLIAVGFFVGALLAIPLAFFVAISPLLERSLYPLILLFQIAPKIALLPLLIIWFGFGHTSAIILTVMFVFFPIMVDSIAGFKSVDRDIFYISRSMGANWWQTLYLIRLPAALPHIFSGFKVSIVLSVTSVIIAEYIGSNSGIGYLVLRAMRVGDVALIFALLFCAALLGILLTYVVQAAEKSCMPWLRHAEKH
ncbi:ABC transporter permease [Mesorhizobium sp. M0909]|uniref:ABC transporter permease n=1 Tax=Mesorhizobium sp. M0909 TaxID=2957024 RepID=UPI00333A260F